MRLKDQLAQSKKIIADINKSWEQKLEETRSMAQLRMAELEKNGTCWAARCRVQWQGAETQLTWVRWL